MVLNSSTRFVDTVNSPFLDNGTERLSNVQMLHKPEGCPQATGTAVPSHTPVEELPL
jgi:hypothetical protein